ncbi:hypothetical protein BSB_30260 [Bacillus stercoris]|nr:hypothetical protein BSB_30260 [Bacillus stercoris]
MIRLEINQLKKETVKFINLKEYKLRIEEPYLLCVTTEDGVPFEFLINIKTNQNKLLVISSGAYDNVKLKPPIFQRYTWMTEFNHSVIYFNDPTLYLNQKLSIGWGQGTKNHFYLATITNIIRELAYKIKVNMNNIFFYGSSAGGFMSLILASFLRATAIVNNPQTDVCTFYQSHVGRLFETLYPNENKSEVIKQFRYRLNVCAFFQKLKHVPKIFYYQNYACSFDVETQLLPFLNSIKSEKTLMHLTTDKEIELHLYNDAELGHNPLNKQKTMEIIHKAMFGS